MLPAEPTGGDPAEGPDERRPGEAAPTQEEEQSEDLIEIRYELFSTSGDALVCPECAPYDQEVYPEGEGPYPPIHPNCRCTREYSYSEWVSQERA
jgi:hypothetical protein